MTFLATFLAAATAAATVAPLRINGLVCAVLTPFDENGALNLDVIPAQATYLNSTGVGWLYVAGTTGESVKISVDERQRLLEAWIAAQPKFRIIAHVGSESNQDAKALAAHAQKVGADAIGVMPPSFFFRKNEDVIMPSSGLHH